MNPKLVAWIKQNIPRYMEEGKMPGFSIALVKDGETVYAGGFGLRDPEKDLPATPDTLYGIGSITKSFVAIGIMQLVEKGEISLEDPINHYLPFKVGLPDNPILIHHLLTHSMGVPSLASSSVALYKGVGADTGIPWGGVVEFYKLVNGAVDEIVAKPGERFLYHNAGWRLLGHLIQVKSEIPFHRYIKEKVMDPLGMNRSTMDTDEFYKDPDHIVPHWKKPDGSVEPSKFPYPNPEKIPDFSFISAAGGIASSVNEMTKYLNAQIYSGGYPEGRLASEDSFSKIQTLHVSRPDGYYGKHGYGYGLSIIPDFNGYKMLGHGGSILVSTAYMAFIPEEKAGVVMMGNSAKLPYEEIAESCLSILLGMDPMEAVPSITIKEKMDRLTGEYETYLGIEKVNVIKKGGMLYIRTKTPFSDTQQPLIPEDPKNGLQYYTLVDGQKNPIEFVIKEDGNTDLFMERYCYHKIR